MILSRPARLCEVVIRHARARSGGRRVVGRPYLARRLDCSTRQVSRYVAELKRAGRLHVAPPIKVRTSKGWRSVGVNTYTLPRPAHPAPHTCRSVRDDMGVTPPLTGTGNRPPRAGSVAPRLDQNRYDEPRFDPVPMPAGFRAMVAAARG